MRNIKLSIILLLFTFQAKSQDVQSDIIKKLDLIENKIKNYNIKDYNILNKKYKALENRLKNVKRIEKENDSLEIIINSYNRKILELQSKVSTLKSANESNKTNIQNFEEYLKKQIAIIENYKGVVDPNLIEITMNGARNLGLDVGRLDNINLNNEIIKSAEKYLNNPPNRQSIESQINILENFNKYSSEWHKIRINYLIDLLYCYCDAAYQLDKYFNFLNGFNIDEYNDNLYDATIDKRKDFLHYNYLINELDKKIENINYNQPIIKCN